MQPAPTPSRVLPDTDTGSRSASEAARRPTVRRSAERPSLPFANLSAAVPPQPTPPPPTGPPPAAALPAQPIALQPMPPPPTNDHARPSKPHLTATIIGPVPLTTPPPAVSGLPQLVANDEISQISQISRISQVGSKPLVNDPKLGWETAVKLVAPDGGHTRLASEPADYRLRSSATWIVLAIMLALAVVVVVVAVLEM
jgi:hypothetical protein